ncbi:TPA: inovirus-type Gp2 protein, partial [Morganella morganii]|nr:inovirus-type Gp2 protein [Morganella morganii]
MPNYIPNNYFTLSKKKLGYFAYQHYALPVYEWIQRGIRSDKRIMTSILEKVSEVFSQSKKILVVRFDLHVKEYSENNQVISLFNQRIERSIVHNYPNLNIHIIWIREHGKASKQHYHCAILVDGQRINHPAKLNRLLESAWKITSDGHFSIPDNCYYLWKYGDNHMLGKIIYRLSYMAKNITKKRFNSKTKRYGIRRLTKNKKYHKDVKSKTLPIVTD